MTPTFSIIIPHKDAYTDLKRCLSTIPDVDDIQVIVVDDNSKNVDETMFQSFCRKNTVFIFNKIEKGAGHARNLALDKATGKWLIFSDCDDYFVDGMYDIAKESVKDSVEDIIFFYLILDNKSINKKPLIPETEFYYNNFNDDTDAKEYMFRYKTMQPWNKIIRRSLVTDNHITFQETRVSNDYFFSVATGFYAKKIKCVPVYFYVYVIRNNQSVSHLKDTKAVTDRVLAYAKVIEFQEKHGVIPDYELLYSCLWGLMRRNMKLYLKAQKVASYYIPVLTLPIRVFFWRIKKSKVPFTEYCPIYSYKKKN